MLLSLFLKNHMVYFEKKQSIIREILMNNVKMEVKNDKTAHCIHYYNGFGAFRNNRYRFSCLFHKGTACRGS